MKLSLLVSTLLALGSACFAQETTAPAAVPAAPAAKMVKVTVETSKGTIELELDSAKAPISVANFVAYAKKGHYDGTIFHRVIPGFMIQGGGFTTDMKQKATAAPIKNEGGNGLVNKRGTICMARTSIPDSATSQFFINVADNSMLDRANSADGVGYAVFGKVTKGMEIADAIVGVETKTVGQHESVPVEPITIKSVKIAE